MKKGRLNLILCLLLIISMVFVSCAPAEVVEEEVPVEEVVEEIEEEEETPVLTLWVDSLFAEMIQEISLDFTEKYGVDVVVQPMGMDDIRDGILVSAPAGEGPDIIEGPHDWVGGLVAGGVLATVELGEKKDLFLPAAIQGFNYEGKLYGIGLITENVALFRNLDIVESAPTTWDELKTVCEDLEAAGLEYCFLLQQGDAYHFFPIQTSFGGYVFGLNSDGSYNPDDVGIDGTGSIAAAQWLDMMVKEGHIKAGIDFDTARALFVEGNAAFYLTGPWNLDFFKEAGVNYAISPIPSGTEYAKPFTGVRGLMVSSFSEQPVLAQTYLTEFWATEEVVQKYYDATLKPSAFLSVREKAIDPDLAALGEAGLYAMPAPAIPEMAAFWATMGDTITLILNQQADPAEAFKNAADQMRTLIAEGQ